MLKELFNHACIVISLLFLGGAFFRNLQSTSPIKTKLLLGLLSGILGSFLMYFSIRITDYILLDLRHVAIIIAVLFGGNLAVILTSIIIGASRYLFFTIGYSAHAALITLILITAFVILINQLRISQLKKVFLMIVVNTGLYAGMYYVILSHFGLNADFIYDIVLAYLPASFLGGLLTYYLAIYIVSSNSSYLELKRQAQYDYLTGLKNVRQFNRLLEFYMTQTEQSNKPLALLFIDIDHFKYINDTFGHPAGDEILRELGRILQKNIRSGDHAFRYGGEEFSILMSNTDEFQAIEIAEMIRKKVEQHPFYLPNGTDQYITVSIGIAINNGDSRLVEIVHDADTALYQAKNAGRNKVCFNKN
jgi:diguanylate cyclase